MSTCSPCAMRMEFRLQTKPFASSAPAHCRQTYLVLALLCEVPLVLVVLHVYGAARLGLCLEAEQKGFAHPRFAACPPSSAACRFRFPYPVYQQLSLLVQSLTVSTHTQTHGPLPHRLKSPAGSG